MTRLLVASVLAGTVALAGHAQSQSAVIRGRVVSAETADALPHARVVIYNDATQKYVMWLHWEGMSYATAEAGVFDPKGVEQLWRKCRAKQDEAQLSNADNMALVGVLSTQLLFEELVKAPEKRDGAKPRAKAQQQQQRGGRSVRVPPPPSWQRAAKRSLILGAVIFV